MDKDTSELVGEWFAYATSDLETATYLYETRYPKPLDHVCHHCQQSAEKFVKGVMLSLGDKVIKTHDLTRLRGEIASRVNTDTIALGCEILTPYATRSRYPRELCIDDAQAKMAIAEAKKVKEWAESIVQLSDTAGDVADNAVTAGNVSAASEEGK